MYKYLSKGCPSLETQFAMIKCIFLKRLGDFNIAKNLFIVTKSLCSGTVAGLGENETMTRIKEQPRKLHLDNHIQKNV